MGMEIFLKDSKIPSKQKIILPNGTESMAGICIIIHFAQYMHYKCKLTLDVLNLNINFITGKKQWKKWKEIVYKFGTRKFYYILEQKNKLINYQKLKI